jgi:hypothetical protein
MEKYLVSKENREALGFFVGIGCGAVSALWLVSWLFHLGPDMSRESPWWGVAYYFSAIAAACAGWGIIAAALYGLVQLFPVSAGAPTE